MRLVLDLSDRSPGNSRLRELARGFVIGCLFLAMLTLGLVLASLILSS